MVELKKAEIIEIPTQVERMVRLENGKDVDLLGAIVELYNKVLILEGRL